MILVFNKDTREIVEMCIHQINNSKLYVECSFNPIKTVWTEKQFHDQFIVINRNQNG